MQSGTPQHRVMALSLVSVIAGVALIGSMAAGWAGAQSKVSYPRSETLITSGAQWGNIAGFNPYIGNYAVGTVGLCYETLLRYDPLADRYINWLAKSAKFTEMTGIDMITHLKQAPASTTISTG